MPRRHTGRPEQLLPAARRATVLGRPIEHIKGPHIESPWLAMDLVYRAPSTAQAAWALLDDASRRVLELCQDIARDAGPHR
ncbi:hypothetical protein [Streptomyces sp. NBC_01320]|uniref:hypothetical protein n=1 Tax=Streptomyces sp. NBC_01320 TaxID=2903824 RepID=UPI002E14EE0D